MKKFTHREKKNFSLIARAQSFTHAWRGIRIFFASTHNAWVQLIASVLVIVCGIAFGISATEWMFLVCAIGFVIATEAMNTAFEIDIDLTSPEYHPYAKDTKDVAAGAVLIATLTALAIGGIIFIPKIIALFV